MGGSRGDEPVRAYVALAAGSSYCEHVLSADVVPRAHLIHVGREATQLRLQDVVGGEGDRDGLFPALLR